MSPVRSRSHPRSSLMLALLGLCLAAAGLRARAAASDGQVFLPLAVGRPTFAAVPLGAVIVLRRVVGFAVVTVAKNAASLSIAGCQ